MNYQMAQQLREAGWKHPTEKVFWSEDKIGPYGAYQEPYPCPTLDDFIRALGKRFYSLEQIGPSKWRAQSFATNDQRHDDRTRLIGHRVDAIVPDIALGFLWLDLYGDHARSN
jgi:hypothetical protein